MLQGLDQKKLHFMGHVIGKVSAISYCLIIEKKYLFNKRVKNLYYCKTKTEVFKNSHELLHLNDSHLPSRNIFCKFIFLFIYFFWMFFLNFALKLLDT